MGSYASEPKVDKESLDEYNDRLSCGASSMQGWRVSQEDAHNCLLDFDTNTSFFAVYDGHGGHEVAQYCAQKLPDFIKNSEAYKEGNIESALIEGFLGFDDTIVTPEIIAILKGIAGVEEEVNDSDDEDNVDNLYEEAAMPIEQVIEKYTSNLVNPFIKNLKKSDKAPKSPCLKAKKGNTQDGKVDSPEDKPETSTSSHEAGSSHQSPSKSQVNSSNGQGECSGNHKVSESDENTEQKPDEVDHNVPKIEITIPSDSDEVNCKETPVKEVKGKKKDACQNGDIHEKDKLHVQENGEKTPKGKGKGKMPMGAPKAVRVSPRIKASPNSLYKKLLELSGEEEESEDEEDATFDGGAENSSDDDEEVVKNTNLEEDSEASSVEGEDDDDDDDDEDDEECLEDEEDENDLKFSREMKDEPGSDSGCTAVVAILRDDKLWVANAGDSRCVVCRNGKAIEMSFDHKPEDDPERERIVKAGGRVTLDGRVNNGLNLSRAIGDHAYKQNKELGPREQMITALPDIKTLEINPEEDEFMILACDGIWNFMSSQEVVDFIKNSLKENKDKLSKICEELFDHCLAPNTMGDGTGCDNMTAIIIQFKPSKKRAASPEKEETDSNKRVKTDIEPEKTV